MPGAVVIVCYRLSWPYVYALSELYLIALQQVTRFPGSAVLGRRVVVQAASPERGRGSVSVQARGCRKQRQLFSGVFTQSGAVLGA